MIAAAVVENLDKFARGMYDRILPHMLQYLESCIDRALTDVRTLNAEDLEKAMLAARIMRHRLLHHRKKARPTSHQEES